MLVKNLQFKIWAVLLEIFHGNHKIKENFVRIKILL